MSKFALTMYAIRREPGAAAAAPVPVPVQAPAFHAPSQKKLLVNSLFNLPRYRAELKRMGIVGPKDPCEAARACCLIACTDS